MGINVNVRVAVIRCIIGLCVHGSVFTVVSGRHGSEGVSGGLVSIDFRVFVAAPAAGAAPQHLVPLPPSNHHGKDHGHDGDDDSNEFSHRQFVTLIVIAVAIVGGGTATVGVGRVVGRLGGT